MGAVIRRIHDELSQYGLRSVHSSVWGSVWRVIHRQLRVVGDAGRLTEWEKNTFMRVFCKVEGVGDGGHTYNWQLQCKETESVFMMLPFAVRGVFTEVQAEHEVLDCADPTLSIIECLEAFLSWTRQARAIAMTHKDLQELHTLTRAVMELIKQTFPSKKYVAGAHDSQAAQQDPDKNPWDPLMKFHVMDHVAQCVAMFGVWENCSAAPMEHKHNHTRHAYAATNNKHAVNQQVGVPVRIQVRNVQTNIRQHCVVCDLAYIYCKMT
jgi:hypothetical protein